MLERARVTLLSSAARIRSRGDAAGVFNAAAERGTRQERARPGSTARCVSDAPERRHDWGLWDQGLRMKPLYALEAVFTITLGCSVMERHLGSMPMSGGSDMEDGLGQQDFARDRDRD